MSDSVNSAWSFVRVDEIFEIKQGKQVSQKTRDGNNQKSFLRTKNVFWNRLDLFELDQMNFTESEEKRLKLEYGDLLLCEGGSVGRTTIWRNELEDCYYQNHLHRLRTKEQYDFNFALFWFWYAFEYSSFYSGRKNNTTIPNLSRSRLSELPIPNPPIAEQKKIAAVLSLVQEAISQQEKAIALTTELKKALMQKLFTEGTRNEPQKMTAIGLIPESWNIGIIDNLCTVKSSSMSYTELEKFQDTESEKVIIVFGVKVSDMNLEGNEIYFKYANLIKKVDEKIAQKRMTPPNAIVFPKRGAAIATNKKRITSCYTVLDPNLIAVIPSQEVSEKYLFHWFNTFDLSKITDPGPTPQLNKKDIAPLKFPLPPYNIQGEIAKYLDSLDAKITNFSHKQKILKELFQTLLHQLMTAQIRVDDLDLAALNLEP